LSDGRAGVPQKSDQRKRKALVIAVSDYDDLPKENQLPFCANDGKAIYEVLKRQNYDIPDDMRLIGRVEGRKLRSTILDFFGRSAQPNDTLVFYFSGHGIGDRGDHYLTSSNLDREYPEDNGFNFEDLERQMARSPAKRIVAFLDCCLAGAMSTEPGKGDEDAADEARGKMDKVFRDSTGRCVLASSLDGQKSYAMPGKKYSQFTHYLLEGLKGANGEAVDENGYVTPSKLSAYIFEQMNVEKQRPITKTTQSGDIVIAEYPELREKKQEPDLTAIRKEARREVLVGLSAQHNRSATRAAILNFVAPGFGYGYLGYRKVAGMPPILFFCLMFLTVFGIPLVLVNINVAIALLVAFVLMLGIPSFLAYHAFVKAKGKPGKIRTTDHVIYLKA